MTLNFTPRPSQENILRYDGGRLGIAAVPGAGKTHILSALAAQIIQPAMRSANAELNNRASCCEYSKECFPEIKW